MVKRRDAGKMELRRIKGIKALFQKKIVKNWSSLFISMVVSSASSFLCFAVLGNKMPVEDYGLFSTMIALATTVSVFVNNVLAGIVANREIAVEPSSSRDILLKFLGIRAISFIFGIVALFIYTRNDKDVTQLVFISLAVLLSFDSFWDLFEQVAFGLRVTNYSMFLNVISSVIWLLVVFTIPRDMASINIILPVYAIICLCKTLIYGFVDCKLVFRYNECSSTKSFKYLFSSSMPYMYNRILGTISTQIPILLLDGYAGLAETAYYSVGEKFATPITRLTTVTISAVFPFLTRALKKDHKLAGQAVVNLFQIILSFGACGALILCATSKYWLVAIVGQKYSNAVEAFNYQIWFAVIVSVDSILSMALSSDFKQKTLSVITTIDALLLVPFLYVGLGYGAKGIAIAKLMAAMFSVFYHLFIISHIFTGHYFNRKLILSWVLFFVLACITSLVGNLLLLITVFVFSVFGVFLLNGKEIKGLIQIGKNL